MASQISFLQWTGGKARLADEIWKRVESLRFNEYVEPFVGGGSIFFRIADFRSRDTVFEVAEPIRGVLGDTNFLLINAYLVVRDHLPQLIKALKIAEKEYSLAPKEYYSTTVQKVNEIIPKWRNEVDIEAAVVFFILNRASFNSLFRTNQQGIYNTPWGQRPKLNLVSKTLLNCSAMLQGVDIKCQDFDKTVEESLKPECFVYLDPPYEETFQSYTADGWNESYRARLKNCLESINSSGSKFLMSNSDTPSVWEHFGKWNIEKVKINRLIAANNDRGQITEVLIRNY